jgi:hypothetical protein
LHKKQSCGSGDLLLGVASGSAGRTSVKTLIDLPRESVWEQFKATRDKEIIPDIYKGNAADARKLADGIQLERFGKMFDIMSCRAR